MPNVAEQHIPGYVERCAPPFTTAFNSLQELLDAQWVQRYKSWEAFHNFCRSKNGRHLMIENEDGTWWWVVAHVSSDSINELPVARMNEPNEKN